MPLPQTPYSLSANLFPHGHDRQPNHSPLPMSLSIVSPQITFPSTQSEWPRALPKLCPSGGSTLTTGFQGHHLSLAVFQDIVHFHLAPTYLANPSVNQTWPASSSANHNCWRGDSNTAVIIDMGVWAMRPCNYLHPLPIPVCSGLGHATSNVRWIVDEPTWPYGLMDLTQLTMGRSGSIVDHVMSYRSAL